MKIETITVGAIDTSCYLVSENKDCFLVDPGDDAFEIIEKLKIESLDLKMILLTHSHFDHILALPKIIETFPKAKICFNAKDQEVLDFTPNQARAFGKNMLPMKFDFKDIKDGDEVNFAGQKIQVIETPGHTPGSVCYLLNDILFSGDTLFYQTVGRTDLLGGDGALLNKSLAKLAKLPEDTKVLPGHGQQTTIVQEKENGYLSNL